MGLNQFSGQSLDPKSVVGYMAYIGFDWVGHLTKDNVTLWIGWAVGLSTLGYNLFKWYCAWEERRERKRREQQRPTL